ncbi:putative lipoprotein [Escherichia coli]|nr:putative lipoprotein [Escherichia coli]
MNLKKTLLSVLIIVPLCLLAGCDGDAANLLI